jgi:rhodanese-related sulfurtransferase
MNKIFIILAFILGLILLSYFYETIITNLYKISSEDAKMIIENSPNTLVIDVRTNLERRTFGFYPGSVHIPANNLETEMTKYVKDRQIIVYCNSGRRARLAAEKLVKLGFTKVNYIVSPYTTLL